MKGFLNKVQGKTGTKSTGGTEGKPVAAVVEPIAPQVIIKSEATPRADISLPKGRERRFSTLI
jgi:hypothetical protein